MMIVGAPYKEVVREITREIREVPVPAVVEAPKPSYRIEITMWVVIALQLVQIWVSLVR